MSIRSFLARVTTGAAVAAVFAWAGASAVAADAPSPPSIKVIPGTEAVYNDPELTARLVGALRFRNR